MRVAAVDLGTNSTRLLVADVRDGRLDEIERRLTITRLGQDVDERNRLVPEAVGRVREVLSQFERDVDVHRPEHVLAIATSAVRDAANGEDFLGTVEREFGFTTRLLTGAEEAELMFRGVSSGGSLERETVIVDIGGGSTELVIGGPDGIASSTSLQIGCVRLTERFLRADPPTPAELDACARHVRGMLPGLRASRAVGVAGTVTTIAALDLGLETYDPQRVHGHTIPRSAVEREAARLAGMTVAERAAIPVIEPGRAAVIVGGAMILREVLAAYRLDAIDASERDILHGAALAAAEL